MKKLCSILAVLFIVPLFVAAPAGAEQPLRGEMDLYFNTSFNPFAPECETNITWAGTITIDEVTYGMAFFPTASGETGKAFHFEEIWTVYEEPFDFFGGPLAACPSSDIVLEGYDSGVTSPNAKYRMSGAVELPDDALDIFAAWDGRRVHMDGDITFDAAGNPLTAPGVFRLN